MLIKIRPHPEELPCFPDVSPLLQRIYAGRGITSKTQLNHTLNDLLPFEPLVDIQKAAERLEIALRLQQRILIVGDFDADGATSTALAIKALKSMGATQVEFLVPNRFAFGYGLTPGLVEVARAWKPHLIVTVDNGIASFEGVEAANQAGIDVLITDHHLPAKTLPSACAIVNPNRLDDAFASKSMAGVGVIFYVMLALRRQLMNTDWFEAQSIKPPNMSQFLDLVALGTVADVVPLDQNNRIMVRHGLLRIRQGLCSPGIQALLDVAGKSATSLQASDLGFFIGPRLNAAGRLDDMALGIECLLSDSLEKAHQLAQELDALNQERRVIESQMSEQAIKALSKINLEQKALPVVLCLMDESWHQGVIGILAGRLKERYHRPVIIFAKVSETELKGSARSIQGIHIRDVLALIDKNHPGLIKQFGGHAMAAGLSLNPANFEAFQAALLAEVALQLSPEECTNALLSDGSLKASDLMLSLCTTLQEAGPWGQQFPEPLFDDVFEILEQRVVGKNHLKMTLVHVDGTAPLDAIAFNIHLDEWPNHRARFLHAAYKLDVNEYRGRKKLQLLIVGMKAMEEKNKF